MAAYYNEIDPKAAAWLRELMRAGLIAPGDVDERDVRDVRPAELARYRQCHFFAGIGVWSHSLRLAGWPDDRAVWTGSCPCQPFSTAGNGAGFDDERHLWPAWFYLIEQCRPVTVFGEQVASDDGLAWLDLVRSDLEGAAYTIGCADLCAAGFGAPHIRQRLFFVADADCGQPEQPARSGTRPGDTQSGRACGEPAGCGASGELADADGAEWRPNEPDDVIDGHARWQEAPGRTGTRGAVRDMAEPDSAGLGTRREGCEAVGHGTPVESDRGARELGDAGCARSGRDAGTVHQAQAPGDRAGRESWRIGHEPCGAGAACELVDADEPRSQRRRINRHGTDQLVAGPSGLAGFWANAEWIYCRDEKWRPVEPGSFPLVDGAPARVVRLRGYGNAIVAPVAAAFVRAYIER